MTPEEAYDKALQLGKRIPKLEPIISKDAGYSYYYAINIIKGRWELGEPTISKDVYYSYIYAKDVVKGRWELGEPIIRKNANTYYSYCYARYVIKGKLPDFMHNQMILSNDEYAKEYIEFIK